MAEQEWQFAINPADYKIPPEVQAERDQRARELRATEPPEEATIIGPSLSDIKKTEGKKPHPLDAPITDEERWEFGETKKQPVVEEGWKFSSEKPETFSESIGEEPLLGEKYIARIGEAAAGFGETFMKPHEHPEYGMYKTLAEQVPSTIASIGAIGEMAIRRLSPIGIFDTDPMKTIDRTSMLWKKRGEELGEKMAGFLPDYLTKEIKKEAEKPAGKAGSELLIAPVYPLVEAGEAIGEKYGEGRAATYEHFMNVGMLALPGAVKGMKTKKGVTSELLSDLERYARENKGVDPKAAQAESLVVLGDKLDEALPQTRQKLKAPEHIDSEAALGKHLGEMADSGQYTLVDMLDTIADSKHASGENRAIARQITELSHRLGLDNVLVDPSLLKEGAAGLYRSGTDELGLGSKARDIASTTVHEAVHTITSSIIDLVENTKGQNLDHYPALKAARDKAQSWKDLYDRAVDTQAGKEGKTRDEFLKELDRINAKRQNTEPLTPEEQKWQKARYGFTNPKEFASELIVDSDFKNLLKNHVVHDYEVAGLKVQTPRERASHFREAREFFNFQADVPGHSIVPILADQLFDMIGSAEIKARTRNLDFTSTDPEIQKRVTEARKRVEDREGSIQRSAEKFQSVSSVMEKMAISRLAQLLKNAPTFGDFLIRFREDAFFKHSGDFVTNYAQRLWENEHSIRRMAEDTGYSKLPEAVKKWASDPRDIDTFMKEEFLDKGIKEIDVENDISKRGTYIFNPSTLEIMKAGGPAGKIMKWVHSKARDIGALKTQVYERGISHLEGWNNLSRKEALQLWDTMQEYNKPLESRRLKQEGKQWIPEEELRAKGLNDAQINAYNGITKMLDYTYDLVNQSRLRKGQPQLEKLPGYIPNVHEGAYKVFVRLSEPDKNVPGYPSTRIIAVRGFKTSRGARKYAEELESGKYDQGNVTVRAESHTDPSSNQKLPYKITRADSIENPLSTAFSEYYDAYQNLLTLDPKTLQMIENLESHAMGGMIKSGLERSSVSGYRGEFGQDRSPVAKLLESSKIGAPINTRMLQTFENSMRQASEFYGNGIFMDEVVEPLMNRGNILTDGKTYYGQISDKLKNLHSYLRDYGYNFTGESLTKGFKAIDDNLTALTIKLGLDPNIVKNFSREVRNYLSLVALRGNPRNYVANASQVFHTLEMLELANSEFAKSGIKTQPAAKSFADVMSRKAIDKDMAQAVQWAKDQGFIEAQLEPAMHTQRGGPGAKALDVATGGKINPAIERWSREMVFSIAYEHMRKLFPDNPMLARDMASKQMRSVMVDYNRAERPLMYTNTGIVGELASPFAVFRNAWFGNTALMLMKAIKERDLNSMKPLIMSQMVFLATAGALGMVGAQDYNDFVGMIKKFAPEWGPPRLEEILMSSGEVPVVGSLLSSNTLIHGGISGLTQLIPGLEGRGIQFGSSQQAVSMSDMTSLPMLDFLTGLGSVGVDLARMATPGTNPVTKDEIWKDFKTVTPNILRPQLEKLLKGDLRVSPQAKSLVGTAARTPEDQLIYQLTGGESLEVTREKQALAINAQKEKALKNEQKTLVNAIADQLDGISTTTLTQEEMARRWGQISNKDITELGRLVTQELLDRKLSQKARISERMSNETFKQMKRLESMQSQ